jgi:hypothetical protein
LDRKKKGSCYKVTDHSAECPRVILIANFIIMAAWQHSRRRIYQLAMQRKHNTMLL